MQVFVKTANGKTVTIDVEISDTIGEVKGKIYKKEEIAPELYFHLKYQHRYLNDESTVLSYNIQKESTLWMVWPFPGDVRGTVDGLGAVSDAA